MSHDVSLYTAEQVRELERRAIAGGIAAGEMMTRAGTAAFRVLRARFPNAQRVTVVCGPGDNGGDGYVIAGLAQQTGLTVNIFTLGDSTRASEAASGARRATGVTPTAFDAYALTQTDVIIDALLGIGIERPLRGEWRAAVDTINASRKPVLAVDIPSGLHADTGAIMDAAVRADVTISFIALKSGLFTGMGREHAGEILLDDLDIPHSTYSDVVPIARLLTQDDLRNIVKPRSRSAHKGSFGNVLAVGGGLGMPGAIRLCGEAAYRTGAGLVTLATYPTHVNANAQCSELLTYGVRTAKELRPLLASANVIAVGPGLSQTAWARALFQTIVKTKLPIVVDADALNFLAAKPMRRNDWILTPHPGEAARLLKTTAATIQRDRFAAVRAITKRYGGVCVLKGSGTLIAAADDDTIWLCDRGNPGMASAGTGDVLTGVIATLRAQGLAAIDAARLGVWLHATAGDTAAQQGGEIGLLASDLLPLLRQELNRLAS